VGHQWANENVEGGGEIGGASSAALVRSRVKVGGEKDTGVQKREQNGGGNPLYVFIARTKKWGTLLTEYLIG